MPVWPSGSHDVTCNRFKGDAQTAELFCHFFLDFLDRIIALGGMLKIIIVYPIA
jgi:hypothetical protein